MLPQNYHFGGELSTDEPSLVELDRPDRVARESQIMKLLAAKPWARTTLFYAGALMASLLVLNWALDLTKADLAEPFVYGGDALEWPILVKNTLEQGWYLSNDRLGAPFGMEFHDYPQPEALHYLQVKLLGLFTDNPFLIVNWLFLLGFPLVTASSLWVCRRLGLSWGPSVVASLLYTFVPYHFHRGESHLWLAAYYTVPLLILLMLWARTEPFLFDPDATGLRPRWRVNRRRALVAAAICVIGGSTGVYYAFFTCALLCLDALCTLLATRRLGQLWTALVLTALLGATVGANLAPNLLHRLHAGPNPEVAARNPGESELYGLKLAQLVVPVEEHRVPILRALRVRYDQHTQLHNENCEALGLVGAVGFFTLLGWLFMRRRDDNEPTKARLAELNLIAFLIGTIGGIGAVFAFTISPMIRGYNRISIFIAFFSFLTVGLLLERLVRILSTRRFGRSLANAALAVVCVAGLLDEVPPGRAPNYAGEAAEHQSDAEFFAAVEARHSPGAMVFQLPYQPFPESPPKHKIFDYDLARPFLNTRAMRWSYGAIRGRYGDQWLREISGKPLSELLETVALAGYEALTVDRRGYPDAGAELEASLAQLAGVWPATSRSNRVSLFDLRSFGAALRVRLGDAEWEKRSREARSPVLAVWSRGCPNLEGTAGVTWRWCDRTGEIQIENHSDRPRRVQLSLDFATGHPEEAELVLDGSLLATSLRVSAKPVRFERTLTIPPGSHVVRLRTDARRVLAPDDPRSLYFRVEHFRMFEID